MAYVFDKTLKDYEPNKLSVGEDTVKEIIACTPTGDDVTIHLQNTVHPDGVYSILADSVYGIRCERVIVLRDSFRDGAQSEIISVGHYPGIQFQHVRVKEAAEEIISAFKDASLPEPSVMSQHSIGSFLYAIRDIGREFIGIIGEPILK